MKRITSLVIMITVAAAAFAGGPMAGGPMTRDPFAGERADILAEFRDRSPADLTFGEMEELAAALSIPAQKSMYVRTSAMSSMMMPGLGQFRNGDVLAGTLFLLGDLAITTGTAVGLYFLLPPELRFDQLDYLNTPYSEIHAAWQSAYESATAAQALPFWGVATGGMVVRTVLAHVSARHAAKLAVENIRAGEVTFEPRVGFMMPHGLPGVGFGLRY